VNIFDADYVDARVAATAPRRSIFHGPYPLLLTVVLLLLAFLVFGPRLGVPVWLSILLPLVLLTLLVSAAGVESRRQERRRRQIDKAWEHARFDRWQEAESCLRTALGGPILSQADRAQAFLLLASLAEQQRRYEVAIHIYRSLLLARIGDAGHLQQAQIALADAKLHNHELTDAVDLIGRLDKLPMPHVYRASLELVRLFQQVLMGHNEDALHDLDERRALFRRFLSTQAGYAYALLAAAFHAVGRRDEAARYWLDATTLIRPDKLANRYALLALVAGAYPAQEHHA